MRIFSKELLSKQGNAIEYTTPGTYQFYLPQRTRAKITLVGSGQYRTMSYSRYTGTFYYSGGSGGAFVGGVYLPAGPYSVYVGHAYEGPKTNNEYGYAYYGEGEWTRLSNSSGVLITAGAYAGLSQPYNEKANGGIIEKSSNLEIIYGTVELEVTGQYSFESNGTGGASRYNGWGRGADYNGQNYTNGYFKLEYI